MISILFEHHFAKDNEIAKEIVPFQYFRHQAKKSPQEKNWLLGIQPIYRLLIIVYIFRRLRAYVLYRYIENMPEMSL